MVPAISRHGSGDTQNGWEWGGWGLREVSVAAQDPTLQHTFDTGRLTHTYTHKQACTYTDNHENADQM